MELKDDTLVLLGLSCPYCGNPTKLVDSKEIYGTDYGCKCYLCKPCEAWVGCHKGTRRALGRIADKHLRELKRQAHEAFDPLWKSGHITRDEAYMMLSSFLRLPQEHTHIGMFDEEMCRRVIKFGNQIQKFINNGENNKC